MLVPGPVMMPGLGAITRATPGATSLARPGCNSSGQTGNSGAGTPGSGAGSAGAFRHRQDPTPVRRCTRSTVVPDGDDHHGPF